MNYDLAARQRLGRAIRAARTAAGYTNRADFADKLKRSARQVQALENGESGVGPDTWGAAAEVLGWPIERIYSLLDGEPDTEMSSSPELAVVSDEDLAAEVLRRMRAGGEHGGDTAATSGYEPTVSDVLAAKRAAKEPTKAEGMQELQTEAARTDED